MNKTTLIKFSFVFATVAVAVGASLPQNAFARETGTVPIIETGTVPIIETGTVPIIKAPGESSLSSRKDNSTMPIIATPSQDSVTAPATGSSSISVTVTVNQAPTVDTTIALSTNNPSAIGLPASLVVHAGSTTGTATVTIIGGTNQSEKSVQINASANGTAVQTSVAISYPQVG